MYSKMKTIWSELNQNVVVNKRELILGITACTLAGILAGMFFSPKKSVTIGSNNTGNSGALPQKFSVPASNCEETDAE